MGKLNALEVKRLEKPGRYGDGDGLWLQVRDVERKSWLLRFMLHGQAREMGLGPLKLVSLAEARAAATASRRLLLQGIDPLAEKQAARSAAIAKAGAMTFRQTAVRYIAAHEAGWRNAKHAAQWGATLEAYVYPVFGSRLVATVDTGDVMKAIEPIWSTKPETAGRVRGRIEAILDYARSRGWREGENPARWKGHVANLLPKRSKIRAVEHHAALPWAGIGAFMAKLREQDGTAALALQLAILTAARTGEVIGATWDEIDLPGKAWTVPASRMKGNREHRVPLSDAALGVLTTMQPLRGNEPGAFVFPGGKAGKGLSNMAMLVLLRRMKHDNVTAHGFRSTFRDWSAEATTHQREVAEAALAHTVGDKTVAAYQRGDLFEKRRLLMDDWATFCSGAK